jgi:hypothetical protein
MWLRIMFKRAGASTLSFQGAGHKDGAKDAEFEPLYLHLDGEAVAAA